MGIRIGRADMMFLMPHKELQCQLRRLLETGARARKTTPARIHTASAIRPVPGLPRLVIIHDEHASGQHLPIVNDHSQAALTESSAK